MDVIWSYCDHLRLSAKAHNHQYQCHCDRPCKLDHQYLLPNICFQILDHNSNMQSNLRGSSDRPPVSLAAVVPPPPFSSQYTHTLYIVARHTHTHTVYCCCKTHTHTHTVLLPPDLVLPCSRVYHLSKCTTIPLDCIGWCIY